MRRMNLNGTWELRDETGAELCTVEVPGTVISGLYAAGKIENPYDRENEYGVRDLFWKDYQFVRSFVVERRLLEESEVNLVCEGLDTLAQVCINGKELASTDNMHRTYIFPVKEYIREGENEICITFRSVLQFIENYPYKENKTIHVVPCGAMKGNQLLRKGHSMFGWDWGPQLVDAGIWRDIYMEGNSGVKIEDVRIRQFHDEDGSVRVRTTVTVSDAMPMGQLCAAVASAAADDASREQSKAVVTVTLAEKNHKDGTKIASTVKAKYVGAVSSEKNYGDVYEAEIVVENPKLWWPNGYGEQPLYTVTVSAAKESVVNDSTEDMGKDGRISGACTVEKTIGLRTLTISQEADEWGNEFAFIVNGVKIFTKGGNYIPEDAVYPWITRERQEYLLKSCVRANFNCVRVWGGGYYPSDAFYDLCDEYGLIVWQDLMYACNVYDVTDDFAATVRQETLDKCGGCGITRRSRSGAATMRSNRRGITGEIFRRSPCICARTISDCLRIFCQGRCARRTT